MHATKRKPTARHLFWASIEAGCFAIPLGAIAGLRYRPGSVRLEAWRRTRREAAEIRALRMWINRRVFGTIAFLVEGLTDGRHTSR